MEINLFDVEGLKENKKFKFRFFFRKKSRNLLVEVGFDEDLFNVGLFVDSFEKLLKKLIKNFIKNFRIFFEKFKLLEKVVFNR